MGFEYFLVGFPTSSKQKTHTEAFLGTESVAKSCQSLFALKPNQKSNAYPTKLSSFSRPTRAETHDRHPQRVQIPCKDALKGSYDFNKAPRLFQQGTKRLEETRKQTPSCWFEGSRKSWVFKSASSNRERLAVARGKPPFPSPREASQVSQVSRVWRVSRVSPACSEPSLPQLREWRAPRALTET